MATLAPPKPRISSTARTERSAAAADGSTLEDIVLRAWEDLSNGRSAECPVCRGPLTALRGCADCGSHLS